MKVERLVAAAFLLAAVGLWAPTLGGAFLADDLDLVLHVQEDGPLGVFSRPPNTFFRPLLSLSLWLDVAVWGAAPLPMRVVNLGWHLAASVALGLLAHTRGHPRPWLLAGSFALLPAHAEPVTWIAARSDLMATTFGLAGLALLPGDSATRAPVARTAAAHLLLAAALLSKESAAPLCLVAPLFAGRRGAPALLLGAGWLLLRSRVVGAWVGGYGLAALIPAPTAEGFARAALQPLRALLPPIEVVDAALTSSPVPLLLGGLAGWLLLLWGDSHGHDRHPLVIALLLTLAPVAALGPDWSTSENERVLYLPSAFALLVLLPHAVPSLPGLLAAPAALALASALVPWQAAGLLATGLNDELASVPPGRTLLLNAPADLQGVPLLWNGASSAWRLAHPGHHTPPAVTIATFHTISTVDTPVATEAFEEGWLVHLPAPAEALTGRRAFWYEGAGVDVRPISPTEIYVRPTAQFDTVWWWTGGRFEVLRGEPPSARGGG